MARAKQTRRAEARRRHRQATSQPEAEELESSATATADERPSRDRSAPTRPAKEQPARPGFGSAFRAAYHPANVREDLAALPRLLLHWSFLAPVAMIIAGAFISTIWWNYSGGRAIYQLVLLPGTGFGLPQLVAGFFAPRASYLLGLAVSLVQGVVAVIFAINLGATLGTPVSGTELGGFLIPAFVAGPLSGMLFAAAAAWYRRFLALSSPRGAARQQQARSSKGNQAKRPAGR